MRAFLALIATGILGCAALNAQGANCATAGNDNAFLNIQTIRLWPDDAPEAKGKTCDDIPALTIFRPRAGKANGSAVIVLPGGAYRGSGRAISKAAKWPTGSPRADFAPSS